MLYISITYMYTIGMYTACIQLQVTYIFSHLVQWGHCWVSAEILVSSEILEGRETSSHYQVSVTLHGHRVNHVTTKPYSIQVSEDEIQYMHAFTALYNNYILYMHASRISWTFMELYSGINSNAVACILQYMLCSDLRGSAIALLINSYLYIEAITIIIYIIVRHCFGGIYMGFRSPKALI